MVTISDATAKKIFNMIENLDDKGPSGYGYQSCEWITAIEELKEAIEKGVSRT